MAPGYGTLNLDCISSWFELETDGPMWALNLMRYREVAHYGDDRDGEAISGMEADDRYAPIAELAEVGGRIVLAAPVVHQLRGDDTRWDRIAIAFYPRHLAMVEMNSSEKFQESHQHKEAGMGSTIVMATIPSSGGLPVGPEVSSAGDDLLLVLQVVGDVDSPDMAEDLESVRLGVFDVEDVIIGDGRRFAQARWDVVDRAVADELVTREPVHDESSYVVLIDPRIDQIAESVHTTLAD